MNRHQRRSLLKKINKKAFVPKSIHDKITGQDSVSDLIESLISEKDPDKFAKKVYDNLVVDIANDIAKKYSDNSSDEGFEDED